MHSDIDYFSELGIASLAVSVSCSDEGMAGVVEAIHPDGALLALAPDDLSIVHAGGDTATLLGTPAEVLPGADASRVFTAQQLGRLRAMLDRDSADERPVHLFTSRAADGTPVDVVAHRASGLLVVEFDPCREPAPDNSLALVQRMSRRVKRAGTVEAFCDAVVAELRGVTGFERVIIYRFAPDGSGKVEAESRTAGVAPLLGLHYPDAEIPRQARTFGLQSWIRTMPDARHAPAAIVPAVNPRTGVSLDLSQSVIRSEAPAQRLDLAGADVVASISLSLVLHGELWGVIACHHRAPRHLPYRLREACELFAELASSQLETRAAAEQLEARLRSTRIHEELVTRMSQESDFAEGLIRFHPDLLDFVPAAGVGLWIDGQFTGRGRTPDAGQTAALVAWLNATVEDGVYSTDRLPLAYPPARRFADRASGLMAMSLSKAPRNYVLWFRPEAVRTITWASGSNRPVGLDRRGEVPARRSRFGTLPETVRLHAEPWLASEIDAAYRLRLSLLEVVSRRIDSIARERKSARLLQEQLMRQIETGLRRSHDTAQTLKEETRRRVLVEADLSQVLRRTVEDQEAERLRIARELHDTLGQSLTLLQLGFENLADATPAEADLQHRIAGMKTLAADIGRQVNRIAWEIRPAALDDLGLQTAIEHLLDAWSETSNVKFDLHMTLEQRLPPAVETTLYRVLQEALTNVVRHAAADHVSVVLSLDERQATMIVEDDGRGFSRAGAKQPPDRLGLLGIRERLGLVSGSFEIESAPGKGTALYATIPL